MENFTENDLVDYLSGELTPQRQRALEAELKTNPGLAGELEEMSTILSEVVAIPDPQPSAEMDMRFSEMLTGPSSAEFPRRGEANRRVVGRVAPRVNKSQWRPIYAIAATLLFLVFGLGWYFGSTKGQGNSATDELAATRDLMLELMQDEQSTNRMQAATVTLDVPTADPQLIRNLGFMLQNDENTNVRLAALNALLRFSDDQAARQEMLDALEADPPGAVRIQLMETLIQLDEKRIVPYLEELIQNDTLPRQLRDAAQLGTFKLI